MVREEPLKHDDDDELPRASARKKPILVGDAQEQITDRSNALQARVSMPALPQAASSRQLLPSSPKATGNCMVQPWTLIDDDDKNCYSGVKEVISPKSVVLGCACAAALVLVVAFDEQMFRYWIVRESEEGYHVIPISEW
jgi:hypothetical protein